MSKSKSVEKKSGNADYTQAVQGLRRSSAAGTHGDRRTKRNRTRAAQKNNSLKGW